MKTYLTKSFLLLALAVIICCGIYPAALWIIGQVFFPFQANGSLLLGVDGQIVGSRLIAQSFTQNEYFQPRPSAANYDASASASSSLAASNSLLRDRVAQSLAHLGETLHPVAADLVLSSASGLDPHISLQNAEYQLDRVSKQWAARLNRDPAEVRQEIEQILQKNAEAPWSGLIGEKLVNVLAINLELHQRYGGSQLSLDKSLKNH